MKLSAHRPLLPAILLFALAGLVGTSAAAADQNKAERFYENALTRYEKKDIEGAIIQLKNALQIDKTLLPVQLLLGKALLADSQPAAAEIAFNQALNLGVNRIEVAVPLARALEDQGKQQQIFVQPALALAGLPPSTQFDLLLIRASASSDMGDPRAAMQSIEDARALNPAAPDSWLAEVPLRIRARQFNEATVAANKALALAPKLAQAYYQKGEILHVQGDTAGALAAYQRALQLDPTHVDAHVARLGLLIDAHRDKDAQAEAAQLAQIEPNEPRAAYLRAVLAERTGDTAQMRADLRQVTELIDPVPIDFLHYRPQLLMLNGLAHFDLEEPAKAKPYLELFQQVNGDSPVSKLLAQIYIAQGSPDRASDLLDSYTKSVPGDAQALIMLAGLEMNSGRNTSATALMEEALRHQDRPDLHRVLGMSLLRGGQSDQARSELETAYKKDPSQMRAGTTLAGMDLLAGQTAKALALLGELLKRQPGNASSLILLGAAHLQMGNVPAARKDFEAALKADPTQLMPKIALARIDIAAKNFDAAAQRLDAILKADDHNIDAMLEMATLSTQRGDSAGTQRWLTKAVDMAGPRELRPGFALIESNLDQQHPLTALDAARQLLAKAPENVFVLIAYARCQLANGDKPGARMSLIDSERRATDNAAQLTAIARLQIQATDLAGAAYTLDKAQQTDPKQLEAAVLAGRVELLQGNFDHAEHRAQGLLQSAPRDASVQTLIGDIASARQQYAQALTAYRRAFELAPAGSTLLALLPAIDKVEGFKAAQAAADQWLQAHPGDLAVRSAKANAQAASGNWAGARASYEALLKIAPNDAQALNNLANVLLHQKDPGAAKVAEQALAQAPSDANVIDTLGWALLQQGGQDARALELLRDARLRAPANSDIRYHLALALVRAGRKAEARDELGALIKLNPSRQTLSLAKSLIATLN